MTFQAYIDNIRVKTGKTPEDFRRLASEAGLLRSGLKAGELTAWLKAEHGLGHGHAMALWAVFQQQGWVDTPSKLKSRPAG